MAELARTVNLSQPAVMERVRKLEAASVITGYTTKLAQMHLVLEFAHWCALVRIGAHWCVLVRIGRSDFNKVKKAVEKTPEVRSAHNITGEDSWLIEITVRDVAHLDCLKHNRSRRGTKNITKSCLIASR